MNEVRNGEAVLFEVAVDIARASANNSRARTLVSALMCAVASLPASAAERVGSVTASKGDAALERADERREASPGLPVLLDDRATTGAASRLDLQLGQGTRIRLGGNTILKIDRFVARAAASTTLEDGAMAVERDKKAEKKFEVKTPYGLLAARGTTFFAGPSNGKFGVFVQEGVLDVISLQGAVTLRAGDGTDFSDPGDPPSEIKKWGAPRIQNAFESVQ